MTLVYESTFEEVICDVCNAGFTPEEPGPVGQGFVFVSHAVCPSCAPAYMEGIIKYEEQAYIRGTCGAEETFFDFVTRMRGGKGEVRVETFDNPDDFWKALSGEETSKE